MKETPLADTSDDSIGVKICAVLTFEQDERPQRFFCLFFLCAAYGCDIQWKVLHVTRDSFRFVAPFFSIPTDLNVMVQRAPTVKAQQARQWVEPLSGLLFLS